MIASAGLFILAAAAAPTLTLGQIEALPPMEAAARMLEGEDHGAVADLRRADVRMAAPGNARYLIVEVPKDIPEGCQRTAWRASFRAPPGMPLDQALLIQVDAVSEIGLRPKTSCDDATFVHVNPGVTQTQAFEALGMLRELAEGTSRANVDCRSRIDPDFCDSEESIQAALRSTPPQTVSLEDGKLEIWLRGSGNAGIAVRFDPAIPEDVSLEKYYPPPA